MYRGLAIAVVGKGRRAFAAGGESVSEGHSTSVRHMIGPVIVGEGHGHVCGNKSQSDSCVGVRHVSTTRKPSVWSAPCITGSVHFVVYFYSTTAYVVYVFLFAYSLWHVCSMYDDCRISPYKVFTYSPGQIVKKITPPAPAIGLPYIGNIFAYEKKIK